MKKNNITLIGMPTSGKSTVGVILAKILGMDFVDTDLIIQRKAGKQLANKTDRTPEEDDMLDMMVNGGKRVSLQNMKAITEWYKNIH